MAATTNLIKQVNLQHVRAALLDLKTATKPQLAEQTNLSVITINALLKTLLATGEALEDTIVHPTLGRPAMSYKLNETYCMALIIYTFEQSGQDTAFFVVRNLYGESVEKYEKPVDSVQPDSFDEDIALLLAKYPSIRIVGFGLPVTESNGIIISSDYVTLVGQAFCAEKTATYHLPVFLVNDIKAATVGYCHTNRVEPGQCVIGIYLPRKYSPGIGVYYNGKLMDGRNGLVGRITSLVPDIDWKNSDYALKSYQDAILQIVHIIVSLYNPDLIIAYSEGNLGFLRARLNEYFLLPIEKLMCPELIIQNDLDHDFRAGITHLALDELFRLKFPIQRGALS